MSARMKRREFITLLSGAAAWPLAASGQQPERKRRIGVLMAHAENDAESHDYLSAFRDGLQKLGWRNFAETTRGRLCCIRTSSQSCPNEV